MIKRLAAVASCWAAEITCELDANAPSRVLGLGHATPAARASATHNWAAGQMFFLSCCPWPLIGFQRRLVEIGKIAHLHLQPPPPSPICFSRQATTTSESCRRKESVSVCRWHVAVSQVKGEYPSRWPTRSGPFFNKRQSWSPPQQAVRRTRRAAMPVEAFAGD